MSTPTFFVPGFEDSPEGAEQTYAAINKFAEEQTGWEVTDRRIFRVEYEHAARHRGKMRTRWDAQVGHQVDFIGEECVAILESNSFLVCTPNRGVLRGLPVLIGQPFVVVDFAQ